MYIKQLFFAVILVCTLSNLSAQTILNGLVIDKKKEAIGFAHVFFKNDQSKGTITNELGEFSIEVSEKNTTDSLVISVLGYHTLFAAYKDTPNFNNVFTLRTSSLMIDEITILSDTYLRYLLKEAIAKIPDNYPTENHLQKAYYQNYTISDTTYAEMIEADITMVTKGYDSKNVESELYLSQLRKSEDNRNLPDRLLSDNNKLFPVLKNNAIAQRGFSKFATLGKNNSLEKFVRSIDEVKELHVYGQYVDNGDTILTIQISDPFFGRMKSKIFSLVSLNKSDLAIVKVVYGDAWADKDDFSEVVYRKINDKYYPSYIRSVLEFEFDQKTRKHYTSHVLMFYNVIVGKKNIKKVKKGKKMKPEKGLRKMKMKEDEEFWNDYTIPSKISATDILRAKVKK